MKFNSKDFEFIFPESGDHDIDYACTYHWVEIKKCKFDPDETTEITVPDGVEVIGEYAFINFINLKKISFPSTLKKIRTGAFKCCKSLETVEFNNPLIIEKNAFRFCDLLKNVNISFTKPHKSVGLIWENKRKPGELPGYDVSFSDFGVFERGAFRDCPLLKELKLCEQMEYYNDDEILTKLKISGGKIRKWSH